MSRSPLSPGCAPGLSQPACLSPLKWRFSGLCAESLRVRRLKDVAVVMDLHEFAPVGGRPAGGRPSLAMWRPLQDGQTPRPLQS